MFLSDFPDKASLDDPRQIAVVVSVEGLETLSDRHVKKNGKRALLFQHPVCSIFRIVHR
jgi:hypothetical protein